MNTTLIKVYPNKLDKSTVEINTCRSGITIKEWLIESVPSFDEDITPQFSVFINQSKLNINSWGSYKLKPDDDVEITIEAKDPATIAYAVIAVIAVGVAIYATNQIPDNYNSTTPDGSAIYDVNTQGNKPRLMGVIPELAGRHKVFPDYLTMPRREYINNEQWLYLMMCITKGSCELLEKDIKIGNTPISKYAGDIEYQIFAPGENVTGHEAHRNVYTSGEVGSTAGKHGMELKGAIANAGGSTGSYTWSFSGNKLIAKTMQFDGEASAPPMPVKVTPPFPEGAILKITGSSSNQNDGLFKLVTKSIDGSTVQKVDENYADDTSWTAFISELNSNASIDVEDGAGDGGFAGPFFAVPEGEVTNKVWLDFTLPQGLGELNDDGDFLSKTVDILIEYRAEGETDWTPHPHSFTDNTNDQLGETLPISFTSKIRPEIRVRRVTTAIDDTRVYDQVFWTALKAELYSPSSYPGMTTIAVKARGTNALAGSAENKFNVIPTRILPVYENGTWSEPKPTADIAPFFAHVIRSAGHSDSKIALPKLQALHSIWSGRNDEFNAVFDTPSTLFPTLKRVLAVGFAEPTIDFGQIVPVRDQKRTVFKHMYQPDNYIGLLERHISAFKEDENDGVEVEYFDPISWKSETILCTLPEDQGINPAKERAFGITNRDKAYQFGMRKRRIMKYRRKRFDFKTEMDALNSSYLDFCALADDIPGYEQTGRVEVVNERTICVDCILEWQENKSHVISLRKPDGTLSGPYEAIPGQLQNEVVISTNLDFQPILDGSIEPPFFMFGTNDRWCNEVLISDIKPNGTEQVSVKAFNYDERVYLDDDSKAPSNTIDRPGLEIM